MNEASAPLLDDKALAALNKTRPWMYLIGICSLLAGFLALLAVIGGIIGSSINPERAHMILAAGIAGFLVCVPSAVVQLGYALALSQVNEATGRGLVGAVELACIRQRNLWIVNGLIAGLATVLLVFSTIGAGFF